MPRRLHAPGCLLAMLSLVAPRGADAAPVSDDVVAAPVDAEDPEPPAQAPEPEPGPEPEPEPEPLEEEIHEANSVPIDEDAEDVEDDESTGDDVQVRSSIPDRLPRLQRIGWYHVLGAFTLGTTAGLLAGLAERQEDKATRIASGYDLETGGAVLYADRQEAYEASLDRGQALETSAIIVGTLAGATAIAAIAVFAVDAKRRGPSATARRTRIGVGSLEVSF
ncbi:MAG: hypothetical protein KUG77_08070 [Nannocystaceae bacterium]|nr:hypothetical protein [Nannocystaceae bacterium]